ncbi:membrane-anchored ubiquitin-fold protein 3-like [Rutidosis leptorrhynchoides]|uniref:membrane-anchored ubiquitin-fold protein 3-like n=1 Tax=Rutidosis leptorrhynchoides TaxID=125765 RepID=UPI003A9A2B94
MAEGNEYVELKFRIYDGADICHSSYASITTIASLKQKLVSEWPQGKSVVPKSVNDIKLIHLGKVLENGKTLSESGVRDSAFAGGVITMHVVIQPVLAKKKPAKKQDDAGKLNSCGCTIL